MESSQTGEPRRATTANTGVGTSIDELLGDPRTVIYDGKHEGTEIKLGGNIQFSAIFQQQTHNLVTAKGLDRGIEIERIVLLEKSGGRSGVFRRSARMRR